VPGDQLPTERKLEKLLGVSRITIRKGVNNLITEGYCYKEKGKGIFVLGEKIPIKIDFFKGMGNYINSLGFKIENQVIEKEFMEPNEKVAKKLQVPNNSKLLYLKRLRIIEGKPLVIEDAYLSLYRIKGLEKHDFTGSLYQILREKFNIFPDHSVGAIINKLVNVEDAHILNIPFNYPVTEKEAVVYDKEDNPIEFVKGIYHSNKFIFLYNSTSK